MSVLAYWKESLKLCTVETIKLFGLLTINAGKEVVRVLCAAWFVIFFGTFSAIFLFLRGVEGITFVTSVISVCFLLAARPSVGIKDSVYFVTELKRAAIFVICSILATLSFGFVGVAFMYLFNFIGKGMMILAFPLFVIFIAFVFISPMFFDIGLLFYLDQYRKGIWHALSNAALMVWYNYPLFLFYFLLFGVTFGLAWLVISFVAGLFFNGVIMTILTFVCSLIYIILLKCLTTSLYIKRVQDQFEIYK